MTDEFDRYGLHLEETGDGVRLVYSGSVCVGRIERLGSPTTWLAGYRAGRQAAGTRARAALSRSVAAFDPEGVWDDAGPPAASQEPSDA